MLNSTKAVASTKAHALVVAFQSFNGVYMAKISNLRGRETHAYGPTPEQAEKNARRNYRRKYFPTFQSL